VVFAFIGGIVADRFNRRLLLIYSLAACAIFSVVLAVFVHLGLIQPWHLLFYAALTGVATSFNHPARSTLLPNLVKREHFLNAITVDNVSVTGSRVIGAILGGFVVSIAGTTPVLGVRAAGALLAMVWIYMIKAPETPSEAKRKSPWHNFKEGMQYVGAHKNILGQVLLYLLPIYVTNCYTGLLPYFATEVLHIGPGLYGLLSASPGLGSILVTFVLTNFKNFNRMGRVLFIGGIAQGLALIVFAFSSIFALALFMMIFIGAAGTAFMSVNNTIIQQLVTDQVRGRVMSLREVSFGLGPSGSLISGALAGVIGVPFALVVAGVITMALMLGIHFGVPQTKQGVTESNLPPG
jgi:MFS family permease